MRQKLGWIVIAVAVLVVAAWLFHRRHVATSAVHGSAEPAGRLAAATGPRAPAAPASVAGHVTRTAGGPIAGAAVSLARAGLGAMFEASDVPTIVVPTDAGGAWKAPKVPPGTYFVAASAAGYLPVVRDRLVIAAGEQRTGIDLALDAGGTLVRGTVTDIGGGAIADVRVTATVADSFSFAGQPEYAALTAADGTYQITLRDGAFNLTATHDDYTVGSKELRVAGKPLVADFVLTPGGVIRGQVIARDTGKPVPYALIDVAHGTDGSSDADGNFVLRSLRSGAVSLTAAGRGYASAAPTVVELGIGEQVEGIKVVVDRAFSIRGKVVKKHEPAVGIAGVGLGVFSMSAGQQAVTAEPTGTDGRFEIVGVRPASYTLFALSEGTVPEVGKVVEVVDHDIEDVMIEMAAGATLSGRVEPPGKATVGLRIAGEVGIGNMFEAGKAMLVHAETDAAGLFVLHSAPAGKLEITAMTPDGRAGVVPITVTELDQTGLVVMLEGRASISGRVIDTNGAPVVGAHVDATPSERKSWIAFGDAHNTASAADGSFRIVGLEAGKYTVVASEGANDDQQSPLDKKREPPVVELAKGTERTGVVLTLEARDGAIHGVVNGADGKPVADAWVTARGEVPADPKDADGDDARSFDAGSPVLTGADGRFTIARLKRATYTLVADGPRGGSRTEKAGVKPGETVTLTLAPLGTLSGHVVAGSAPVTVYDLACTGPAGPVDRRIVAADGGYALEHLAPGSYTCDVSADGGTAKGKVEVPPGAATLDLTLVAWASLTGVVVSVLSGQPVPGVTVIVGDLGAAVFGQAMLGNAQVTDPSGRFVVEHVAAGKGRALFLPKEAGLDQLALRDYTAVDGQRLDLGTIKIVPPRTTEAGTLGMATAPADGKLAVTLVSPGGPADQAGVQVGDKIMAIDGRSIADLTIDTAQQVLASGKLGAGEVVVLGLERGVTATLTAAKW